MSNYYEKDGFKLARVTSIISDCTDKSAPLTQWAANMATQYVRDWLKKSQYCDRNTGSWVVDAEHLDEQLEDARFNFRSISKEALDIGSEVHAVIESYLKDMADGTKPVGYVIASQIENEQVQNAFIAFTKWAEGAELHPISIEKTVYGNGWAGTLDFYGYMNGKLYVIDWKSSKAIYPEMRYQIAAYGSTIPLLHPGDHDSGLKGCGILRLDKLTGMPEFKDTSKTYEQDLEIFNRMVDLYFARHPRIRKKAGRE